MIAKRSSHDWRIEAECWARYLIGGAVSDQYLELYSRAMQSRNQKLPESETRLIQYALQHPWSISYLDAGLALFRPQAELRGRLHLMSAILETVPEYASKFLPKAHSRFYVFIVGWTACKATLKAMAGLVLIKLAV